MFYPKNLAHEGLRCVPWTHIVAVESLLSFNEYLTQEAVILESLLCNFVIKHALMSQQNILVVAEDF